MSIVGALNIFLARSIKQEQLTGEALRIRLTRHRTIIQAIGMLSICVTAIWGMYQNLVVGPFGG